MNLGLIQSTENYAAHGMVPSNADIVVSNAASVPGDRVNLKELTLEPGEYVVAVWPYSR